MNSPRLDKFSKNLLTNGNFEFFQEALIANSLGPVATPDYLGPDMFLIEYTSTLNSGSFEQHSDVPEDGTKYSGKFIIDTVASTNILKLSQRVESINAMDVFNSIISGRFDFKTDGAREVTVRLSTANATDNFTTTTDFHSETFTILDDGNWDEIKFENITVPVNIGQGFQIDLEFSDWSITGADTFVNIAKFKVNEGTTAQDFSRAGRNHDEEYKLCKRYFQKIIGRNGWAGWTEGGSTTNYSSIYFQETMRIPPTLIISNVADFKIKPTSNVNSINVQESRVDSINLTMSLNVGIGANLTTTFWAQPSSAFLAFDARL